MVLRSGRFLTELHGVVEELVQLGILRLKVTKSRSGHTFGKNFEVPKTPKHHGRHSVNNVVPYTNCGTKCMLLIVGTTVASSDLF